MIKTPFFGAINLYILANLGVLFLFFKKRLQPFCKTYYLVSIMYLFLEKMKVRILFFLLFTQTVFAQTGGIKGYIRNPDGEALPWATIYVKNSQTGTATNMEGYYELKLPEGKYQITFQYLSYQTLETEVVVGKEMRTFDVKLELQAYMLRELTIKANAEDPAYTIMRKAIAMSKVHKLQVDAYDARIYVKGRSQILDIPFLLKRKLEKEEGIMVGKVYLTETITDLHFEQPNKYVQKVVSMRSSEIDSKSVSPMDYIQASFYDPQIGTTISPLSPSAFAYYKFTLESTFRDQDFEINKIRVTPRSRGDDIWEGHIYIVENKWCIHSLQLKTEKLGVKIGVQQTYSPVQDGVFMPIMHQFDIGGRYLGFEAEFKYIASVTNYKVKVNPNFIPEVKLIDEKIEKEKAEALKRKNEMAGKINGKKEDQNLEEALAEGKELRRKDLKKMLKEAEKKQLEAERKALKTGETAPSELVRNDSTVIDSLARKRGFDSLFWEQNRTIPLTELEIKTYKQRDSLVLVDSSKKSKEVKDSTMTKAIKTKKFKPWDLVLGGTYKLNKTASLTIHSPLEAFNYNTVEGYVADYKISYRQSLKNKSFRIAGIVRYAHALRKFTGRGEWNWAYWKRYRSDTTQFRQGRIRLDGGQYIEQFNAEYPIPMMLNTLYSLLFEQNFMKIYQRNYARIRWQDEIKKGLVFKASFEYAQRQFLENNTNEKYFDWQNRDFTPNAPENLELAETVFPKHEAAVFEGNISYKPFLRYGMKNGRKYLLSDRSPVFTLQYRKGLANVDYDFLAVGVQHKLKIGIRGTIGYAFSAGAFLNTRKMYFPDYKHFNGNRIFVQFADPVNSFRLMDYYRYSTADHYAEGHAYIQFRKFLLSQFIYLRSFGWRENLFVNQLVTPKISYTEAGYTLDGILRIFRVEAIAAFENGQYKDWGIRIGITTTFGLQVDMD